ncbi:MAG TPA: hypothetical protein VFD17_01925 [Clostridia bacterium]|nr:hypothetical protein [Clostridia bacterium]
MKRYGHVQTEIPQDEKYLQLILGKYEAEGYNIEKVWHEAREHTEYHVQLDENCHMILTETYYIEEGEKRPLITQVIYKTKEEETR